MTFVESLKACITKYAEFKGRAARPEFWWFCLFVLVGQNGLTYLHRPLGAAFGLAIALPFLAAQCRRLHDIDRAGWWNLLPLSAPFFGAIPAFLGFALDLDHRAMMIPIVLAGLSPIALLFIWYAKKGDPGLNRFGPPPLLTLQAVPETVTPPAA